MDCDPEPRTVSRETVSHQADRKRQRLSEHTEHVQKLRSQMNELQKEKLEIDAELQQRTTLEETQAQLLSDNTEHDADIKVGDNTEHDADIKVGDNTDHDADIKVGGKALR